MFIKVPLMENLMLIILLKATFPVILVGPLSQSILRVFMLMIVFVGTLFPGPLRMLLVLKIWVILLVVLVGLICLRLLRVL